MHCQWSFSYENCFMWARVCLNMINNLVSLYRTLCENTIRQNTIQYWLTPSLTFTPSSIHQWPLSRHFVNNETKYTIQKSFLTAISLFPYVLSTQHLLNIDSMVFIKGYFHHLLYIAKHQNKANHWLVFVHFYPPPLI